MVNKVYVEKKAFDFGFVQPTLSEYRTGGMAINKKHDLPLLFNTGIDSVNTVTFSENLENEKIITETRKIDPTSNESEKLSSNDLTSELLEVVPVNDLEGDTVCAFNECSNRFFRSYLAKR